MEPPLTAAPAVFGLSPVNGIASNVSRLTSSTTRVFTDGGFEPFKPPAAVASAMEWRGDEPAFCVPTSEAVLTPTSGRLGEL